MSSRKDTIELDVPFEILIATHYRKNTDVDMATGQVIALSVVYLCKKIATSLNLVPLCVNVFTLELYCPQEIDEYWSRKKMENLQTPDFGHFCVEYTHKQGSAQLKTVRYLVGSSSNPRTGSNGVMNEKSMKIDWIIVCVGSDKKLHQLMINYEDMTMSVLRVDSISATTPVDTSYLWHTSRFEDESLQKLKFENKISDGESFRAAALELAASKKRTINEQMTPNLKDQLKIHPDGYYIARVIVGTLRIGNDSETMVIVDPLLTLDDRTEMVTHYALCQNRLELRSNGTFRRLNRRVGTARLGARLMQMAVATWEFRDGYRDSRQNCVCHSNFFDRSVSHCKFEECSIRRLCGLIAEQIRHFGDVEDFVIPSNSSAI
ncbi:hypothetical protein L3Y34_013902 [Caenorhabditis briggsae]|uniref:Uncharacterized protein n=2 Tax=Caenorhabditis briggsae TaxID=6238 RepID=A0AAE8ZKZ6_CAEBR|nr:hypothetical protein L3Y34_010159 [Caenorhabditis briggsae]ULU09110.1 hypothetical protein L3Y34_013902 [Caenorhabditis briggsae]